MPRRSPTPSILYTLAALVTLTACGDDGGASEGPECDRSRRECVLDADRSGGPDGGRSDGGDASTADTGDITDTPVETGPPPTDADGDGISDRIEGGDDDDADDDGIPNYLDLDSDDDGIPDAEEYRRAPLSDLQPSDLDNDGVPDFLDVDSDGDGLLDEAETGCPDSTDRTAIDSDGDGLIDMVEIAFGSDPCDNTSDLTGLVDFFFELPYMGEEQVADLPIRTRLESGDVHFSMDVTGSMSAAINSLKDSLESTIIPVLAIRIADIGIGVSSFADYPCDDYGNGGDLPFELHQRVTTDAAAAQAAVAGLSAAGGGDTAESAIEALYQMATGSGRSEVGCPAGDTPAFDSSAGEVPGVADGAVAGVGFRPSEVRVIVQITDAPSHASGEAAYPYGATRSETYDALEAIGAHVIGLAVGQSVPIIGFETQAIPDLREAAIATGGVVDPCAWGDAGRPVGCGLTQCCTGVGGAGQAPVGGECPLVFSVSASIFGGGGGVDYSVISGIEALLGGTDFEITAELRRDEEEFADTGLDTTCFINGVVPVRATPRGCAAEPTPADTDGDSVLDGFTGVSPGSTVYFEVRAQNDCVEETNEPQVFFAYIDLFASNGTTFGDRVVTILVPPAGVKR